MKNCSLFKLMLISGVVAFLVGYCSHSQAAKPKIRVKFYDFSEQLIDGVIKKPKDWTKATKKRAKFKRLLELRKNFLKKV